MLKLSLPKGSQPFHVKTEDAPRDISCPLKLRREIIESPKAQAGLTNELYTASSSTDHPLPQSDV